MAVQEIEDTTMDATIMKPSRVASTSKLCARASAPLAPVSLLLLVSCFCLVIVLGHEPIASSGLHVKVLLDQEKRVVMEQRA